MDAEAESQERADLAEDIGYNSNPEWYFERQKQKEKKHVNRQFEAELQKQMAQAQDSGEIVL